MGVPYCPSEASGTTFCEPFNDAFLHRVEEAEKVLRTSKNLNEIVLVCSLFPFPNPQTRHTILSRRSFPRLDRFLNTLQRKDHDAQINDDKRSTSEKAEDIVKTIDPDVPIPSDWEDQWSFPIEPTTPAESISYIIQRKVLAEMSKVDFRDFSLAAFGYLTSAMNGLQIGATNTQCELRRQFHELGQPTEVYELAAKKMNPLAKWLLSTSISDDPFPNPHDTFHTLFIPIRNLFMQQDLLLLPMLRRLGILKALYQIKVLKLEGSDDTWESLSSADFSFVDQIASHSPGDLANELTLSDQERFRELCGQDFYSIGRDGSTARKELSRMRSSWSSLADAVNKCASAHPDLVEHISETTKELLDRRNFHSGMAFLQGIRDTGHCAAKLSEFWELLDSGNRYEVYRTYAATSPSLLLVFPHVDEVRRAAEPNKSRIVSELFQSFLAYSGSPRAVGVLETSTEPGNLLEPAESKWSGISDLLWVVLDMLFQIATRLWTRHPSCAFRLPERPHRVEDLEKGIHDSSKSAIPVRFDNQSCRNLDLIHGRKVLARLKSERIEKEEKQPRINRKVRMRCREFCPICNVRTGRRRGQCMKCNPPANEERRREF